MNVIHSSKGSFPGGSRGLEFAYNFPELYQIILEFTGLGAEPLRVSPMLGGGVHLEVFIRI